MTGHNLVAVWSVSSRKPILEFPYDANLVAFSTDDTHLLLMPNEIVNAHGIFALSLGPLLRGVHSEVKVARTPDPPRTDPNSVDGAAFDVSTQAFTLPDASITLSRCLGPGVRRTVSSHGVPAIERWSRTPASASRTRSPRMEGGWRA